MKRKPKLTAALLALALAALTACSAGTQSAAPDAQSASSAPAASAESTESEAPAEEQIEEGSVVAASMNTITILTADGRELNFPTVDATVEAADGLLEGDWVQVTYRGALNGTDTTGVRVDRVVDLADHTPDIEMADVDETVYTTGPAGLFAANSTSAEKLADLAKGTQLHRTGKGPHGWSRVEYNGQVGYVFGDYLTTTAPQSQPAATTDASVTVQDVNETVYATVRLRIRASASLDGAVLGVATPGTQLTRTGVLNNGWSKVIYNNTAAYCDSEYLTTTKPAEAVNHDETPAGEVARSEVDATYYTSVALKLHVTYAQDSSVVAVAPMGTALHVQYLLDNHWAQVEYGGQTAYCVSQFLVTEQPAATQNAPVETAFTDVDDVVYPIAALHIRETPSLGGKVLSTPDANTEWRRTGISADGQWSRVEFNGVTGYAASQYLTNVRPGLGATEEQETNETVTTTAKLRLHETTDVDSPVVAVVPAGTALHRVAYTADGWSIVLYNGETVYCATQYVTR